MRRELAAWKAWQKRMRIEEVCAALFKAERLAAEKRTFAIYDAHIMESSILFCAQFINRRGLSIVISAGADGLIGGAELSAACLFNGGHLANDASKRDLYQALLNFSEGLGLLTRDELAPDFGNFVGC